MVSPLGLVTKFTDRDGRFVLKNCEDKEYRVEITEKNQNLASANQVVRPSDKEVEIVVRQENRPTASAKGQVVDADGRSVRSAKVRLLSVDGRGRVRAKSGFFGGFRAGPAPPGEYRVSVEADGGPLTWLEIVTLE